jgi:N-acetylglucosamine-6-phosphate deacetylase
MIRVRCDRILVPGGWFDGFLYIEGGKIAGVDKACRPADESIDLTGRYLTPGFIDIHTHGAGGHAFTESSAGDVAAGCAFHMRHGTTAIMPTVSAGPVERMEKALCDIREAARGGGALPVILGAHMEGPYLSPRQSGAQCPDFIKLPDRDEYTRIVREYGDCLARWTYAPETDPDGEFCRYIAGRGIIASAGHTDATYRDMQTAAVSGCSLVTHLYSCTSTVTRSGGFRIPGVIESAFLMDGLKVEIIADGKHLPPELIRLVLKIKGRDGVIAVTDSLEIAGTDVTSGVMSGTAFIVEDGVCKLPDRSAFAGSVATSDRLVRVLAFECGLELRDAVAAVTSVPAELLGLKKGRLEAGYDADAVAFDEGINITDVFVGGRKVIG